MALIIDIFQILSDNYGYLVHDEDTGATASIDAGEAEGILKAAERRGWTISDIFITHHHADHTDGIAEIKAKTGAKVTGPAGEADKISGLDRTVSEGDTVSLGQSTFDVIAAPGHTLGHICFHDREGGHVFTADALFSLGCGRMFEGTPGPMWAGLAKLRDLPDETLIYCGHEYTSANAKFALSVDPDNAALQARAKEISEQLANGEFTIPVTLGAEKAQNPFLRADDPGMARQMGLEGADPAEVFAAIRKAKDNF